jgi:hypothetical protein
VTVDNFQFLTSRNGDSPQQEFQFGHNQPQQGRQLQPGVTAYNSPNTPQGAPYPGVNPDEVPQ